MGLISLDRNFLVPASAGAAMATAAIIMPGILVAISVIKAFGLIISSFLLAGIIGKGLMQRWKMAELHRENDLLGSFPKDAITITVLKQPVPSMDPRMAVAQRPDHFVVKVMPSPVTAVAQKPESSAASTGIPGGLPMEFEPREEPEEREKIVAEAGASPVPVVPPTTAAATFEAAVHVDDTPTPRGNAEASDSSTSSKESDTESDEFDGIEGDPGAPITGTEATDKERDEVAEEEPGAPPSLTYRSWVAAHSNESEKFKAFMDALGAMGTMTYLSNIIEDVFLRALQKYDAALKDSEKKENAETVARLKGIRDTMLPILDSMQAEAKHRGTFSPNIKGDVRFTALKKPNAKVDCIFRKNFSVTLGKKDDEEILTLSNFAVHVTANISIKDKATLNLDNTVPLNEIRFNLKTKRLTITRGGIEGWTGLVKEAAVITCANAAYAAGLIPKKLSFDTSVRSFTSDLS